MKVFATGFNLFGQFKDCEKLIISSFIDLDYAESCDLELGHSFAVLLQIGNRAFYNGAKNQKTRETHNFELPQKIVQVSCAETRILLLSDAGDIFKVDLNEDKDNIIVKCVPKLVGLEKGDKIVKVGCGSKISVALTKEGCLFNIPTKLEYTNKTVTDIKVGREHCLILDQNGTVFTFGCGSRGQLGHGNLEDETEPKLVKALAGIPILAIAAGGWHSCALSRDGDLYTWGWNSNGQLGLPENETVSVMATPHVVDVTSNDQLIVKKVACGNRHTIVLTDSNDLYGCGWNKYQQLGIEANENVNQMRFLKNFGELQVDSLKCGPWNTAVVCSSR